MYLKGEKYISENLYGTIIVLWLVEKDGKFKRNLSIQFITENYRVSVNAAAMLANRITVDRDSLWDGGR